MNALLHDTIPFIFLAFTLSTKVLEKSLWQIVSRQHTKNVAFSPHADGHGQGFWNLQITLLNTSQVQGSFKKFLTVSNTIFYAAKS